MCKIIVLQDISRMAKILRCISIQISNEHFQSYTITVSYEQMQMHKSKSQRSIFYSKQSDCELRKQLIKVDKQYLKNFAFLTDS